MPANEQPRGPALSGLMAVNALALLALAAVTFAPRALAQSSRTRGDYMMVSGGANGANASVVYIVDTINQEMIAVTFEPGEARLRGIAGRSLRADAADLLAGRVKTGLEATKGGQQR